MEHNAMHNSAGNHYWTPKDTYKKHLHNNITKDYLKVNDGVIDSITKDDKKIADSLEVDDRMYRSAKRDCFITLKDHKKQFMNNPKFRQINPGKPDVGDFYQFSSVNCENPTFQIFLCIF